MGASIHPIAPVPLRAKPVAGASSDVAPPSAPLVRGKRLRSDKRRAGAILAAETLRRILAEQHVSQHFLAAALGVDQSWVHENLSGRSAWTLGDAFVVPKTVRRALGLALLLSAENDNESHR